MARLGPLSVNEYAEWKANMVAFRKQLDMDDDQKLTTTLALQERLFASIDADTALLETLREHITELEDAWLRGAITEHDSGTRSNRNAALRVHLNKRLLRPSGEVK